jgi:UDP-3-O-[3-hydroxymyristoyl] glucosamine N-acyltransferase
MKLIEIAEALDAALEGDGSIEVDRPVHPAEATSEADLALAMDKSLVTLLGQSAARVAVVRDGAEIPEGAVDAYISVGRSRYAMAGLTHLFDKPVHANDGIHETAVIAADAVVAADVSIGPFTHVGPAAKVGAGTILMSHVTIGAEAELGEDCLLHAGARVGERVVLGDRVIIHHNASLGGDGFSFVTPEPGSVESAKRSGRIEGTNVIIERINSIGTVIIGDDAEVGACTAIDRGTISATRIGNGTKIDGMVIVGHNVTIGENCMLCGQVGIAGSAVIGDRVVLAGKVGVADHVKIGNDVVVGASSGVAMDLPDRGVYLGVPAVPKNERMREYMLLRRLESMFDDLRSVKKRLNAIESSNETG